MVNVEGRRKLPTFLEIWVYNIIKVSCGQNLYLGLKKRDKGRATRRDSIWCCALSRRSYDPRDRVCLIGDSLLVP